MNADAKLRQIISEVLAGALADFEKKMRSVICAEVTSQLQVLKKQLDIEVQEDISAVSDKIRKSETKLTDTVDKIKEQLGATQLQMVTTTATRDLVAATGKQVAQQVHTQIVNMLNKDIVPKLNNMVQYVNYQMQDTGEVITDYRRAVERQANEHLQPGQKMLTDGKVDKQVLSEHVRMFFGDED